MEVITFSPDMDLSSKEAGDVFRLNWCLKKQVVYCKIRHNGDI